MAEIKISISEIIDLCVANEMIPDSVSDIEILSERIRFKYKNVHPIPINIDLEICYKDYSNGLLFIEVRTSWITDKFLRFKKLPESRYLQYEHPILTFFLEQFIIEKTKIMHIESIHFNNGYFKIKTFNE